MKQINTPQDVKKLLGTPLPSEITSLKTNLIESKKPKRGRKPLTVQTMGLPDNWKEIVYEQSAKGISEVGIRAYLCMLGGKFSDVTWDALKERDSEFLGTINKGKVLCQAWWEKKAIDNLEHSRDDVFETAAWFINMKNRFGWRDKTEVEHAIADETFEKYKSMSVQDLEKKLIELMPNRVVNLLT